jgi:putative ABC transport system permease protein
MRAWEIVRLALGGLRRSPLRAVLTGLGVAIGSAALVAMVAFAIGLQIQAETPFRALALLNNIQVSLKEGEEAKNVPPLDDEALARMEQIPGVDAAYPDIRVRGVTIRHGDKTALGLAVGMPRESALFGIEQEMLVAGRFFTQGTAAEAVVGIDLLKPLGFETAADAVGTQVTLELAGLAAQDAKSFTFQEKQLEVEVVGVYQPPPMMPAPARSGIALPVDLMKRVPGVRIESMLNRLKAGAKSAASGYDTATVRVHDPANLDAVERQIQAMGYRTRTVLSRLQQMRNFFLFLQVLLAVLGGVALLIAALGIVNTLLMAVLERYQEIGLYKAIGASDRDLLVLFLTEAATLGLLGSLGGLLLGWLVSLGIDFGVNVYLRHQGATEYIRLFAFPFWLIAATVGFSVCVSILAGVYPALRAARIDPIRALREG